MNTTAVQTSQAPWYTQNAYLPATGNLDAISRQVALLHKSLQDSDLQGARQAVAELRKNATEANPGSPAFKDLVKAVDKGDLDAARKAYTAMAGKESAHPPAARPVSPDKGKGIDLYG